MAEHEHRFEGDVSLGDRLPEDVRCSECGTPLMEGYLLPLDWDPPGRGADLSSTAGQEGVSP